MEHNLPLSTQSKILLIGNYGDGNLGDEAILEVLLQKCNASNVTSIAVPSKVPGLLKQLHSSKFTPIKLRETPLYLCTSNMIIIGGGGLFSRYSGFFVYLLVLFGILSKLLHKKVYYYGIGFSTSTPALLKYIAKLGFLCSDHVSVRDIRSYNTLLRLGVSRKKISLIKDVALELIPTSSKKIESILTDEKIPRKKYLIGMALNYTSCPETNALLEHTFPKIVDTIINETHAEVIYFTFCPAYVSTVSDRVLGEEIKCHLVNPSRFHVLKYYPPDVVLGIFMKLDASIAMRFHSQVFSSMAKIPFYGISYEEKCASFLEEQGAAWVPVEKIGTHWRKIPAWVKRSIKKRRKSL